jgi:RNA polymerase sigma-70 factor (ECF subfamily)
MSLPPTQIPAPRAAGPVRSDAELAADALVDGSAFDELFRRHVDAIYAFTCARVGPSCADDIVAETFAVAFQRLDRFDRAARSMRPWLYGIAVNRLRKQRDSERRWIQHQYLELADAEADVVGDIENRIAVERITPRLVAAMQSLTPGERDVLLLYVLEDVDHEAIAAMLGIRPGTAKSRLSRARARLRALLGAEMDR